MINDEPVSSAPRERVIDLVRYWITSSADRWQIQCEIQKYSLLQTASVAQTHWLNTLMQGIILMWYWVWVLWLLLSDPIWDIFWSSTINRSENCFRSTACLWCVISAECTNIKPRNATKHEEMKTPLGLMAVLRLVVLFLNSYFKMLELLQL